MLASPGPEIRLKSVSPAPEITVTCSDDEDEDDEDETDEEEGGRRMRRQAEKRGRRGSPNQNTSQSWNSPGLSNRPVRHTRVASESDIEEYYEFGCKLGQGTFGVVFEAKSKKDGRVWAIKAVNKEKAGSSAIFLLEREVSILKRVSHEHIIHLEEVFETSTRMFLVMEFCRHGELASLFEEKCILEENDVRTIIGKLASAISYLHKNDVMHRDLKLENILIGENPENPEDHLHIKVTDFGLAILREGLDDMANNFCGTPAYMAPEILDSNKGYSQQCDVWAMGVIMYILLYGQPPFVATADDDLYEIIKGGKVDFNPTTSGDEGSEPNPDVTGVNGKKLADKKGRKNQNKDSDKNNANNNNNKQIKKSPAAARQRELAPNAAAATTPNHHTNSSSSRPNAPSSSSPSTSAAAADDASGVSDSAKSLIQGMLTVDPAYRLTASEVLHHPWTKGEIDCDLDSRPSNVLNLMKEWKDELRNESLSMTELRQVDGEVGDSEAADGRVEGEDDKGESDREDNAAGGGKEGKETEMRRKKKSSDSGESSKSKAGFSRNKSIPKTAKSKNSSSQPEQKSTRRQSLSVPQLMCDGGGGGGGDGGGGVDRPLSADAHPHSASSSSSPFSSPKPIKADGKHANRKGSITRSTTKK